MVTVPPLPAMLPAGAVPLPARPLKSACADSALVVKRAMPPVSRLMTGSTTTVSPMTLPPAPMPPLTLMLRAVTTLPSAAITSSGERPGSIIRSPLQLIRRSAAKAPSLSFLASPSTSTSAVA